MIIKNFLKLLIPLHPHMMKPNTAAAATSKCSFSYFLSQYKYFFMNKSNFIYFNTNKTKKLQWFQFKTIIFLEWKCIMYMSMKWGSGIHQYDFSKKIIITVIPSKNCALFLCFLRFLWIQIRIFKLLISYVEIFFVCKIKFLNVLVVWFSDQIWHLQLWTRQVNIFLEDYCSVAWTYISQYLRCCLIFIKHTKCWRTKGVLKEMRKKWFILNLKYLNWNDIE